MDAIQQRAARAIREKVFPGCVIGVARKDGSRYVLPSGQLTYADDSPLVTEDTIYDLASVTKSIPVASLALMRLKLATRIVEYLPELNNHFNATIEDLLRYRVQGVRMSMLKDKRADDILEEIMRRGFAAPPSPHSEYSNLPAFLLGLILERESGKTLDVLAQEYFFDPLGMTRTSFGRTSDMNIAPTELDESGEVRGIVHDESARVFAREGRAVGHAGLFSTAPDLLMFLEALLRGDVPRVVAGAREGIGWQTSGDFLGSKKGKNTFGKTGFTGTSVVCDYDRGVALVILSNRTYPHRPADSQAVNAFRRDIADLIAA